MVGAQDGAGAAEGDESGAAAAVGRTTDILNGKRGVSPETALLLARYFGASARFWVNWRTAYEMAVAGRSLASRSLRGDPCSASSRSWFSFRSG
jgi:plasmid maintenance system antidote protein VapI